MILTYLNQKGYTASCIFLCKQSFVILFAYICVFESIMLLSLINMDVILYIWVIDDSLGLTTVRIEPEQKWHLIGVHRIDFCEREREREREIVVKWTFSLKKLDFIVKKENEFCLSLLVRGCKKQVFWHHLLQSNKSFGTFSYKVTSPLILFATK